jgi:hypothetical protein
MIIGNDLEGSERDVIEVLRRNFRGGTERNQEKPVRIVGFPAEIRRTSRGRAESGVPLLQPFGSHVSHNKRRLFP